MEEPRVKAARIGQVWYDTLPAAVAAAREGDTVTLCADICLERTLVLDRPITITTDGQRRTIRSEGCGEGLLRLTGACSLLGAHEEAQLIINGCGAERCGALVHLQGAGSVLRYVTIQNNVNTGCGGGLYAAAGAESFCEYCTICDNEALRGGGGLVEDGAEVKLNRCTLRYNRAREKGGAFRVEGRLTPTGCIVENNTARADGSSTLLAALPAFNGTWLGHADGDDGAEEAVWRVSAGGDTYASYADRLCRSGYEPVREQRLDKNTYGTFTDGRSTVTLMDTPGLHGGTVRIVIEPTGVLPQLHSPGGDAVTEPSVTMLGTGCSTMQNGMSFIYRLRDGRFVVVDGGYTEDAPQVYRTMQELAGNDQVTVAAWFITHAHGDHAGAFCAFWRSAYAAHVTLEKVIYNLPGDEGFAQNIIGRPSSTRWRDELREVIASIASAPEVIRAHPGQVLTLSDMTVRMLYTTELMAPDEVWNFNDTSLVFSLELGGVRILQLGDCARACSKLLLDLYDQALQCDVLQAAHHGHYNNCVDPALYQRAGGHQVLWASTWERYTWSENRGAPANQWLFEQERCGKKTVWCAGGMVRTFRLSGGLEPLGVTGRLRDEQERGEQSMDIKLVGLDLDGTVLDDDRRVRQRTIDALRLAAQHGINLAVISGRNFMAVPQELRELPFIRYYVLCNGAGIYDKWNDALLFQADIPLDEALDIYRSLEEEDVYYDCYLSDGAWTQQSHYDRIDEFVPVESHRAFLKVNRKPFPDLCQALRQRGKSLWKVQAIYKDTATRDREMARLQKKYPQYAFVTAYSYNMEVNMPAATKGQGLMQLARILGLERSQIMAFGDGGNDVSMLQSAGVGVAMGNACDEAKAAAACVGPTNNADGVAQVLEALVIGETQVRQVCRFKGE